MGRYYVKLDKFDDIQVYMYNSSAAFDFGHILKDLRPFDRSS